MATVAVNGSDLEVRLSPLEKLGAFSAGVRVPLASVTGVRVAEDPRAELRGIRVGTGLPFVVALGRMLYASGMDFVAIYGRRRTLIVELASGAGYRRIMVSGASDHVVDEIRTRLNSATS